MAEHRTSLSDVQLGVSHTKLRHMKLCRTSMYGIITAVIRKKVSTMAEYRPRHSNTVRQNNDKVPV